MASAHRRSDDDRRHLRGRVLKISARRRVRARVGLLAAGAALFAAVAAQAEPAAEASTIPNPFPEMTAGDAYAFEDQNGEALVVFEGRDVFGYRLSWYRDCASLQARDETALDALSAGASSVSWYDDLGRRVRSSWSDGSVTTFRASSCEETIGPCSAVSETTDASGGVTRRDILTTTTLDGDEAFQERVERDAETGAEVFRDELRYTIAPNGWYPEGVRERLWASGARDVEWWRYVDGPTPAAGLCGVIS